MSGDAEALAEVPIACECGHAVVDHYGGCDACACRLTHDQSLAAYVDAERDRAVAEALTKAALRVDYLFINVKSFDELWDRGYRQGVKDGAYQVREVRGELRAALPDEPEGEA